jgi:hypothetical protein
MNRDRIVRFAFVISCSICASGAANHSFEEAFPFDEEFIAETEARFAAIEAESEYLGAHQWAAEYYEGDGLGANISVVLAPQEGVAARWQGCTGLYGLNHGTVTQDDTGRLRFAFRRSNPRGFGGFPESVVPIRWDERRYLIPADELLSFVNAINLGREPRRHPQGRFLLASGDEQRTISGPPTLPPPYAWFIRSQSLTATVTDVRALEQIQDEWSCSKRYELDLDRGAQDGLVPGIELAVLEPIDIRNESVTITSVTSNSAVAKFMSYADDCASLQVLPTTGWSLATGAFDPTQTPRDL